MKRTLAGLAMLAFLEPASGAETKQKGNLQPQQKSSQSVSTKPKSTLKAGKMELENQKIDQMKTEAR